MVAVFLDLLSGWVAVRFIRNLALAIVCAAFLGAAASGVGSYLLFVVGGDSFTAREIGARAVGGLLWHPVIAVIAAVLFRWRLKNRLPDVASERPIIDFRAPSSSKPQRRYATAFTVAAALACVAIAGGATYVWLETNSGEIGHVYYVHDIVDQDNDQGNVRARLHVYLAGQQGHTKEITCLFPPQTEITQTGLSEEQRADYRRANPDANVFDAFDYVSYKGIFKFRILAASGSEKHYCEAIGSDDVAREHH